MLDKNSEIEMYDFKIFALIRESYYRSNGVKWIFLAGLLTYIVIAVILNTILGFIIPLNKAFANDVHSLLSMPVLVPIMLGINMLSILHVRAKELRISSIFDYFIIVWPLVFASLAMYIMIGVGIMLLIIPGIYLVIAYRFTLPLIADKNMGIWDAMELSRKSVTKRWFKFFGLDVSLLILILISAIPFGIGLIWTIPLSFIANGLLYHHIFDDEEDN